MGYTLPLSLNVYEKMILLYALMQVKYSEILRYIVRILSGRPLTQHVGVGLCSHFVNTTCNRQMHLFIGYLCNIQTRSVKNFLIRYNDPKYNLLDTH